MNRSKSNISLTKIDIPTSPVAYTGGGIKSPVGCTSPTIVISKSPRQKPKTKPVVEEIPDFLSGEPEAIPDFISGDGAAAEEAAAPPAHRRWKSAAALPSLNTNKSEGELLIPGINAPHFTTPINTPSAGAGPKVDNALADIFGGVLQKPTALRSVPPTKPKPRNNFDFSDEVVKQEESKTCARGDTETRTPKPRGRKKLTRGATMSNLDDPELQKEVWGEYIQKRLSQKKPPLPPGRPPAEQKVKNQNQNKSSESKSKVEGKGEAGKTASEKLGLRSIKETDKHRVVSERIDALELMKSGTQFLKYGSYGFPHFRHFHLTEDNTALQWYSKKKSSRKTRIEFGQIEEIVVGQKMPKFKRHRAPELEQSSFSIIYNKGKTLDLIAIQPREFKIWITGLRELFKLCRNLNQDAMKTVNHLYMTVKTTSKIPIHMRKNRPINVHGDEFPDIDKDACTGDKEAHQKVVVEYEKLKKKVTVAQQTMASPKVKGSAQYKLMKSILNKIFDQLHPLKELLDSGDYKDAEDAIWRAGVSLQSLDHMISCKK